jgi:predicted transglutaminase-like cysteine proteinase
MMRAPIIILYLLPMLLWVPNVAHARFASLEDVEMATELYREDVVAHADGTSDTTIEIHQKILKEGGRNQASHSILTYLEGVNKLTILSAKTLYKGKEYPIPASTIEDKPLASSAQGFDQSRQVLLSFPNAEIGATIVLKYKIESIKVPLDRFFSFHFNFGDYHFWNHAEFTLRSELPIFYKSNDPSQAFQVNHTKEGKYDLLTLSLQKPVCHRIVNESENSVLNPIHQSWVTISTLQDWKILAARMAPRYEAAFHQTLPAPLKQMVAMAAKEATETAQINSVTSQLSEKVHYMGDWRTIDGMLYPRDLATIMATQIGDCKDFTAAAGAALRALGYKAQAVSVMRGVGMLVNNNTLPSLNHFNHAMLRITSPHGHVYWVDPTNMVSMADGIFPDIAGKMALILDSKAPDYTRIPTIDPHHSVFLATRTWDVGNPDFVAETSTLTFKGEKALALSGIALHLSPQEVEEQLYNYASNTHLEEQDKKKMVVPDLSSRIVKDFSLHYSYHQRDKTLHTNLGNALHLSCSQLWPFMDVTASHVADLYIADPAHTSRRTIIQNAHATNIEHLNTALETPWLKVKRTCRNLDRDIEILDEITIPSAFLRNEDIRTPAYQALKRSLEQHFRDVAIVYNPIAPLK